MVKGGDEETDHDIKITYTGGDKCVTDSSKTHEFEVLLACDHKQKETEISAISVVNACKSRVTMTSREACPKFSSTAIV